jgi:hypothetical protein
MSFAIVASRATPGDTLTRTAQELSQYGEVELIWEEETHKFPDRPFDTVYAQPGSLLGLDLVSQAEMKRLRVINRLPAIMLAMDRAAKATLLQSAGLPVPSFTYAYPPQVPFKRYVAKGLYDIPHGLFKMDIRVIGMDDEPAPPLPMLPIFAQEYVESTWEYKISAIGQEVWLLRRPTQDAVAGIRRDSELIPMRPDLMSIAENARKLMGLDICSLDFLEGELGIYLIDVNFSTGGTVAEGPAAIARLLANAE